MDVFSQDGTAIIILGKPGSPHAATLSSRQLTRLDDELTRQLSKEVRFLAAKSNQLRFPEGYAFDPNSQAAYVIGGCEFSDQLLEALLRTFYSLMGFESITLIGSDGNRTVHYYADLS